ncbi:hypothetical protein [Paraglaciecola sp. 25GB23A]|jgi:hypothetical protein|uniref:hypothetical protein n=1 Tax=Paraglaciecola sp. 25GB23A TaxID=3156068 RepID=UPI0032AF7447
MDKPSSSANQQLALFLDSLSIQIAGAHKREDLRAILRKVSAFGRPLRYDNRAYWISLSAALLTAALALLSLYFYPNNVAAPWFAAAAVLTSLVFASLIYVRRNKINGLSDALYQRDVYLDNAWQSEPYHGKSLAAQLGQQFSEFRRGNHLREISWLVKGEYQGSEHHFEYHAYNFHYVDRRQVTTTDSKGRVRTRTVYDHHYRFGLYLPFEFVRDIAISSSWFGGFFSGSYKPASVEFNRKFKVKAQNELAAAKFLKPAVVVEIEDLGKELSELNLEFSSSGQLCISYAQNICSWQRQYGLDNPEQFLREIEGDQTLTRLHNTLKRIHTLMRFSDNNF